MTVFLTLFVSPFDKTYCIVAISIIICTRDRPNEVKDCLNSIIPQIEGFPKNEIILVNNSTNAKCLRDRSLAEHPQVREVWEPRLGLSHARNRGIKEAQNEWLCYLDDDTRILKDFFLRINWVVANFNFDCFGGTYQAWYKYGKPKWLPEGFGTKEYIANTITMLTEPQLSGGIFLIKKTVIEQLNGFDSQLGMSAQIRYGEETELQMRLLQKSYSVGFDPLLIVDHAVLPHKLKLLWHLKSRYAHGRDGQAIRKDKSFGVALYNCFRTFATMWLIHLPKNLGKVLWQEEFYVQNALLDSCTPFLGWLGRMRTIISSF